MSSTICSGTKLVLVSDGVTEAFNPNDDQFGTQRVEKVIVAGVDDNAVNLTKRFAGSLREFRGGKPAFDDTTLLVAEVSW
ncbi:MAG: SpoIIE family protein phosphatase [Aureliella sp.]